MNSASAISHWNEIRTAASVAKLGTVSAASSQLNVHRATITRHIDSLETSLGVRLFLRHRSGYTATKIGQELLRIAETTSMQVERVKRMVESEIAGHLGTITISTVETLSPLLLQLIGDLKANHSGLSISIILTDEILKLEKGEADAVLRIGPKPTDPDNVVIFVRKLEVGFFAPLSMGSDWGIEDLPDGCVAGASDNAPSVPYLNWLEKNIPSKSIGMRSSSIPVLWDLVRTGKAVGFLPRELADPALLTEVCATQDSWQEDIWFVTHVDMHRSTQIQEVVRLLKSRLRENGFTLGSGLR